MPPPGASAPAFAATVEPASSPQHTKPPKQDSSSTRDGRVLGNVLLPASILDFVPRLENRCKDFPVYTLFRASILDFKPRLENRCKDFPIYGLLRALILKFKPRLENRCKLFPVYTLFRASILDFKPRLGNHCRISPAELVVSTMSASDSNLRCRRQEKS